MAEAMSGPVTHCPWCSAPLPDAAAERCPSCGAALAATGGEGEIKGVTTLDTEAILRARSDINRPRSRILSFITGEVVPETGEGPASPDSLAPPPDEVRREMLRLQLEAERADLAAETVALKSDELARRGIHLSQLGVDESALAEPVTSVPQPTEAPAAAASDTVVGAPEASRPDAALPSATALPAATALPPAPVSPAPEPAASIAPPAAPTELHPAPGEPPAPA